VNGDLVNSFHLLLCSLNLVYLNVIVLPIKSTLINENFYKILEKKSEHDIFKCNMVIDELCQSHYVSSIETKTINEHYFKPFIEQLIKKEILFVNTKSEQDAITLTRLIDYDNEKNYFDINRYTLVSLT
jgi:retinoblastoma-like protein 1